MNKYEILTVYTTSSTTIWILYSSASHHIITMIGFKYFKESNGIIKMGEDKMVVSRAATWYI